MMYKLMKINKSMKMLSCIVVVTLISLTACVCGKNDRNISVHMSNIFIYYYSTTLKAERA